MSENVSPEPPDPAQDSVEARDDALIAALAAGATYAEAAPVAKLSERQVYRKMAEPPFRRKVEGLRNALMAFALGRLCTHMREAADKILLIARSRRKNENGEDVELGVAWQTQLTAARAMLELPLKINEHISLEPRLREVEEWIADFKKGGEA
jgi:hypothetical protein